MKYFFVTRNIFALYLYITTLPLYAGEITIQPKFEAAGLFHEGVAPVLLNSKWGFIDRTGSWIREPYFESVKSGSQGRFPIKLNGKWGYSDASGNISIEPQYDSVRSFSEGFAAVKTNNNWFMIDFNGNKLSSENFFALSNVKNDIFAAVRHDDKSLRLLLVTDINDIGEFSERAVLYADKEKITGVEIFSTPNDFSGGRIQIGKDIEYLKLENKESLVIVGTQNESLLFWKHQNSLHIANESTPLLGFHKSLHNDAAYCWNKKTNKYYIYEIKAALVFANYRSEKAFDISNRLFKSLGNCDGEFAILGPLTWLRTSTNGLITTEDDFLSNNFGPIFEHYSFAGRRSEFVEKAYAFSENYSLFKSKAGKFGFFKTNGDSFGLEEQAVYEDGFRVSEGMAAVKLQDKWGYITFNFEPENTERGIITLQPN